MHVLIVTTEWPAYEKDITGIHVVNQVNRLKEAEVETTIFNFLGHKNPLNYLKAALRFNQLDLTRFDLIHAHHGQSAIVALSQNKLPVVVTFHGSDVQGLFDNFGHVTFLGRVLRQVSRLVAKLADEVIIVSEHLKSYLPARSYHVIPIGIDVDLFTPIQLTEARQKLGLPLDRRIILFIGDPNRTEKRFWLAKKVVEYLRYRMDFDFILANSVLHDMMPYYMNACDALLITSSSEGSPTIVKEALACDLPIVSTDVGDVRERIGAIKGCIICKDDHPETISEALAQVITRGERIEGRKTVLDLDERILTAKVIEIYQSILSKD